MDENIFEFEDYEGFILVRISRKAIIEWLQNQRKISPPADIPKKLYQKTGVFVTLKTADTSQLRGCIGYPYGTNTLIESTIEAAIESATQDPRFPPLQLNEAQHNIVIEVSVLTRPILIDVDDPREYPKYITIGEDGLIVEGIYGKGLLLPQVASENNMDAEEFLTNCCLKAGLSPDSWLLKNIQIRKFRAEIFSEKNPDGEIGRKIITEDHGS